MSLPGKEGKGAGGIRWDAASRASTELEGGTVHSGGGSSTLLSEVASVYGVAPGKTSRPERLVNSRKVITALGTARRACIFRVFVHFSSRVSSFSALIVRSTAFCSCWSG